MDLFDRALCYAIEKHSGQKRKLVNIPYILHPMEVAAIVGTMTDDQATLAAAVLHDTVEDTEVTLAQIREAFGDRVARLVETESDPSVADVPEDCSWRDRKQAAIDRLAAAPEDAKIVALGDKLSNMRAIARDYHKQGDALWSLFHAPGGKPDHAWHYHGLARALSSLRGTEAYTEFAHLVLDVFGRPVPDRIDFSEWERNGGGFTADSYNHKDGRRMIKLYASFIPKETIFQELDTVWNVQDLGIKTPHIYRLITDGERLGTEYQRIHPKKSFARLIADRPDLLERQTIAFAAMCRTLHATPCNTLRFPSAASRFSAIIRKSTHFSDRDKEVMLEFVRNVPECDTCLHGDMHIGNVILNTATDEAWWIDIADFSYGSPWYDLGMFHLVCCCDPEDLTQFLFHLDNATMQQVWNVFVKHYFGPDADIEAINRRVAPFTALYMVHFGDRDKMLPHMRRFIENTFHLPPAENI